LPGDAIHHHAQDAWDASTFLAGWSSEEKAEWLAKCGQYNPDETVKQRYIKMQRYSQERHLACSITRLTRATYVWSESLLHVCVEIGSMTSYGSY
jgi:hypothetical protein